MPGHYRFTADQPGSVLALCTELAAVGRTADGLARDVGRLLPTLRSAWSRGGAGDAASTDAAKVHAAVATIDPSLTRASGAFDTYAQRLRAASAQIDDLNDAYDALSSALAAVREYAEPDTPRMAIAYDRAYSQYRSVAARVGFTSLRDIDAAYTMVIRRLCNDADHCSTALRAIVAPYLVASDARPGDTLFGASVLGASLALLPPAGLTAALARLGYSSMPTDPAAVARLWAGLSAAERAALLRQDPARFGSLGGIPAGDRDTANRELLGRDLAAWRAYCIGHGVIPPPTDYRSLTLDQKISLGIYTVDEGAGLVFNPTVDKDLEVYADALSVAATLDLHRDDSYLLAYDATAYGHEGRAAISFGNPDLADNVAICVPGLESRVSKMDQIGADASNLYSSAGALDPNARTAVIAWQGYDAPEWLTVPFQIKAEAGAQLLTGDVAALRATSVTDSGARLTVVAHSYGSTTAGLALQDKGLAPLVDQVILLGSPGVGGGAVTYADLHLRENQVYVGSASGDLVATEFDTLGTNPAEEGFGGTRFHAEHPDRAWRSADDHSRYYSTDPGAESLGNIATIVVGDGGSLQGSGQVAAPKHVVHLPGLVRGNTLILNDPETSRPVPTA